MSFEPTKPQEQPLDPNASPLNRGPVIQPNSGLGFGSGTEDGNSNPSEPTISQPKQKPHFKFDDSDNGSSSDNLGNQVNVDEDSPDEFNFQNNGSEVNPELESADKTANKALVTLLLGVFALLIPYLVKSQVKINENAVRADIAAGILEPEVLEAVIEINQKNSKIPVWSKEYEKMLKQPMMDVLDEYKIAEVSPTTRLLIALGSVGTNIFLVAKETQQANQEYLRTLYQTYGKAPSEPKGSKNEEPPLVDTEEVG